ncbi:glucose-1-phosphate cytidylyltransferase [candidate division KSB1 bacterium]|nr:MAG: glucose-1-phosphate cytidylyltransferase [candidate division KSB1 bacterium]
MKVVLFCGGLGMRLREYSEAIPKPMVNIGYRPIIWHVMKYYAHYGHKEFILCLGYKADVIKNYFLNYNEYLSNDFTLANGGRDLQLVNSDIHDWKITFVDTGLKANIGERLKAVEKYLAGEEVFMANYGDGLTDFHLPKLIDYFYENGKTATFLAVRPNHSFHIVCMKGKQNGLVNEIQGVVRADLWINGGFFIFTKDIFKHIKPGEELVHEPFTRLIEKEELIAYKYDGFWASMETFKDKQNLDDMMAHGETPWEVWKTSQPVEARFKTFDKTNGDGEIFRSRFDAQQPA